jgi:hypothetical protein
MSARRTDAFVTAEPAWMTCVGNPGGPSANINEADIERLFQQSGFDMRSTTIEVEHVPDHKDAGYQSIVLASGRRGTRDACLREASGGASR